jgi:hypothetical protein
VRTEDDVCTLSEIADISGPQAMRSWVGDLLLTIEDGVITREQVISALKVSGLEGVRIELKMPMTVKVEKGSPAPDKPAQGADRRSKIFKS